MIPTAIHSTDKNGASDDDDNNDANNDANNHSGSSLGQELSRVGHWACNFHHKVLALVSIGFW